MNLATPSRWSLLALYSFFLAGCYQYVPVRVTVLDARTGEPIVGQQVNVEYMRILRFFPPDMRPATTNSLGQVILSVAIDYGGVDHPCPSTLELQSYYWFSENPLETTLPIPEFARLKADADNEHCSLQPISLSIKVLPSARNH